MFLIVLWHSKFYGIFPGTELPIVVNVLFGTAIVWHVDCFVAISGYYGIRLSGIKLLKLIGLLIFAYALSATFKYFVAPLLGMQESALNANGAWFLEAYILLMLVAPVINLAIEEMAKLNRKEILWLAFPFVVGLTYASYRLSGCTDGGGVVLMTLIYVIARVFRVMNVRISHRWMLTGVLVFLIIAIALAGLKIYLNRMGYGVKGSLSQYNAPHVFLFAIAVAVYFATSVRIRSMLGRVAAFLSPSMLSVYLLHDCTSFGHLLYLYPQRILQNWFSADAGSLIIVLSAAFAYMACIVIDLVRRVCVNLIVRSRYGNLCN